MLDRRVLFSPIASFGVLVGNLALANYKNPHHHSRPPPETN